MIVVTYRHFMTVQAAGSVTGDVRPQSGAPRRRGKSKVKADGSKNWKRPDDVAVIVLELDVSGHDETRWRLEKQWSAAYQLERAIKADARARTLAFDQWKAGRAYQRLPKAQRGTVAKQMRVRLGLTPEALTAAAYRHIEGADACGVAGQGDDGDDAAPDPFGRAVGRVAGDDHHRPRLVGLVALGRVEAGRPDLPAPHRAASADGVAPGAGTSS